MVYILLKENFSFQTHVYHLMKSDSYSRYLRSEMYKDYINGSKKKVEKYINFIFINLFYIFVNLFYFRKFILLLLIFFYKFPFLLSFLLIIEKKRKNNSIFFLISFFTDISERNSIYCLVHWTEGYDDILIDIFAF